MLIKLSQLQFNLTKELKDNSCHGQQPSNQRPTSYRATQQIRIPCSNSCIPRNSSCEITQPSRLQETKAPPANSPRRCQNQHLDFLLTKLNDKLLQLDLPAKGSFHSTVKLRIAVTMAISTETSSVSNKIPNSVSVSSETTMDSPLTSKVNSPCNKGQRECDDNDKKVNKENETLEERRQRRKDRLHARVLVGGVSGLIVGGIFGGPIGSAIVGPATVAVVATTTKCGEICKDLRTSRRCHSELK